ncbi:MAG: phosphoribosylaminoimidazolesuccinocarboxamide synthase [Planctomycetes bacterium]|nr:phosphoribosylaminoimidazolesuccinocarboxamide synthase [Planctomycetota bacterium]
MTARDDVVLRTELPGETLLSRGKVRDVYDLGDHILIVASDRISAFDVVFAEGIPDKGRILTQVTRFWFERLGVPNHMVTTRIGEMPERLAAHRPLLEGRSMLVRKLRVFPIECVVRGYLAGSGLAEYRRTGTVCGIPLPPGLEEASSLPEPIFTPSTKAAAGHDENIPFEGVVERIGRSRAEELRDRSIEVYRKAAAYAEPRGLVLCDTKFEWGIADPEGPAILADEVLTPDSSRFWPREAWSPGRPQPSFDKQFLRDHLIRSGWDRTPPPPSLPPDIIAGTAERYRALYERLTGKAWERSAWEE